MVKNTPDTGTDLSARPLVTDELCLIKIDEERIRAKLSAWNGDDVSNEDVRGWLSDVGFLRLDSLWICEPEALKVLDDAEIRAVCRWPAARHADADRNTHAA